MFEEIFLILVKGNTFYVLAQIPNNLLTSEVNVSLC